jgi:hypothetical protein
VAESYVQQLANYSEDTSPPVPDTLTHGHLSHRWEGPNRIPGHSTEKWDITPRYNGNRWDLTPVHFFLAKGGTGLLAL